MAMALIRWSSRSIPRQNTGKKARHCCTPIRWGSRTSPFPLRSATIWSLEPSTAAARVCEPHVGVACIPATPTTRHQRFGPCLVALDRWVTEGVEPPPSRVPTLAAGTLVAPTDVKFPAIPEMQRRALPNRVEVLTDWVHPESTPTSAYTPLVSQVDGDGNEVAGIRLPAIAVPLATHTGWNLYKAPYPEGELCDREGSYVPFAKTKAERLANGDPRPSLEERYGNHEAYVQRVKEVVRELQDARSPVARRRRPVCG